MVKIGIELANKKQENQQGHLTIGYVSLHNFSQPLLSLLFRRYR
jgi:hypothetical protein